MPGRVGKGDAILNTMIKGRLRKRHLSKDLKEIRISEKEDHKEKKQQLQRHWVLMEASMTGAE